MSRSGYSHSYNFDNWSTIRWRGAVASSLRGKRGQAFLCEALAALDALPEPQLIPNDLQAEGGFCILGAVGARRGIEMTKVDPDDHDSVAGMFAIPHALACEIMFENDEGSSYTETPEQRFTRMRRWIVSNIRDAAKATSAPS